MIRRVNTGQMVTQTQGVLLPHAKVVGLVLRGLLEMFCCQGEEPRRVPRMRDAPLRTTLSAHSYVNSNIVRTE